MHIVEKWWLGKEFVHILSNLVLFTSLSWKIGLRLRNAFWRVFSNKNLHRVFFLLEQIVWWPYVQSMSHLYMSLYDLVISFWYLAYHPMNCARWSSLMTLLCWWPYALALILPILADHPMILFCSRIYVVHPTYSIWVVDPIYLGSDLHHIYNSQKLCMTPCSSKPTTSTNLLPPSLVTSFCSWFLSLWASQSLLLLTWSNSLTLEKLTWFPLYFVQRLLKFSSNFWHWCSRGVLYIVLCHEFKLNSFKCTI